MVTRVVRERLEWLRRAGRRCKLIYTIVNFQNPAGPDLSLRRRTELVELAAEYDTLILEDDAYGELRFEGETKPPVYALDRAGRVIRAGTLSKILGAGVRLGWLCAPRARLPGFHSFHFRAAGEVLGRGSAHRPRDAGPAALTLARSHSRAIRARQHRAHASQELPTSDA